MVTGCLMVTTGKREGFFHAPSWYFPRRIEISLFQQFSSHLSCVRFLSNIGGVVTVICVFLIVRPVQFFAPDSDCIRLSLAIFVCCKAAVGGRDVRSGPFLPSLPQYSVLFVGICSITHNKQEL